MGGLYGGDDAELGSATTAGASRTRVPADVGYTGGVNPAGAFALVAGATAAAVCADTLSTGPVAAALMLRMRLVGPVE
ncbi:hypothetical protein ACIF8W_00805 [Streptomyces sp. NPDC085639]|uniref:hypothetical protein n=1 Tax=Streptomyces sp. NPDC085639 TaxID=3365734 RepID=UPI0037D58B69